MTAYTDPSSSSFANSYQSALTAGYTDQTARNLTHLRPAWYSENIGQMTATIQPDELMKVLTDIINSDTEPTIVRLKAVEMTMRAYSMLSQRQDTEQKSVYISVDLTG